MMSCREDCSNSMETAVDVDSFWDQLSSSQREVLVETIQFLETSAEMPVESDFSDLQEMKKSKGNERARESGNERICCSSVISNSPGVLMGELQPITEEDQSLFADLTQNDFYPVEDSHDYQPFQSHGIMSPFNNSHKFCANLDRSETAIPLSPVAFELNDPFQTVVVDDEWEPSPDIGVEGGSPGEVEPTKSSPTSGSPGFVIIVDSYGGLSSPHSGLAAGQQLRFDFSRLNSHPSRTTTQNQEIISSSAVDQIQVVKTECREEWPGGAEVSEGEFDVKKERRRQQNRTAARRCRNRKKQTFEHMLKAAQKMKVENVELQKAIVHLREKLKSVMECVKQHHTHCGLQLTISQLRSPFSASPS